jgi:hypothetical protein
VHADQVKTLTAGADAVATRREDHHSTRQHQARKSRTDNGALDGTAGPAIAFAVDQMRREVSVADNGRNWQAESSGR